MSALWAALAAVIKALVGAFFERKDALQQRADDRSTGARDAADETDLVIDGISDAQRHLPAPAGDADALVRELRERAARDDAAARRGGAG